MWRAPRDPSAALGSFRQRSGSRDTSRGPPRMRAVEDAAVRAARRAAARATASRSLLGLPRGRSRAIRESNSHAIHVYPV